MNRAGRVLFGKRKTEVGPEYNRDDVFVKDKQWSAEVVKNAVVSAGFDFKKFDSVKI